MPLTFLLIFSLQSCLFSGSESIENITLTGTVEERSTYFPKKNVEVIINDSITARTDSRGVYAAKISVGTFEFKDYENKEFKLKIKLEKDTLVTLIAKIIDTTWSKGRPIKKMIWFDYVEL